MPHDDTYTELAALAALGTLEGKERTLFDEHLHSGCGSCERELREWNERLGLIALAAPAREPSPMLRQRIVRLAERSPARPPAAAPKRPAAWLAAAAVLAIAALLRDDLAQRRRAANQTAEGVSLHSQLESTRQELSRKSLRAAFLEDADVETVLLSGLGPQKDARGKIVFSPKARRAILLAMHLEPLPAGKQYELWFIAAGKPIAAGTFDRGIGEASVFESSRLPEGMAAEKFAVTIEPSGGTASPSGPMVLLGPA